MQDIRNLKVNRSDLSWLCHTSESTIKNWEKTGLRINSDGKFLLSDAIAYLKKRHRIELKNKLLSCSFSQQHLTSLFGVSRQALVKWSREGLPRNPDQTYELKQVVRWLRAFYNKSAEKKYQAQLAAIRKKLSRNFEQSLRFINRDKREKLS